MKYIHVSTKQLRENFPRIRAGLKKGKKYILIHRSKLVARITPVSQAEPTLDEALAFFANPPEELLVKSKKSAVELVREDRSR